jgi:hypothetical protein
MGNTRMAKEAERRRVPALKVTQWLRGWNSVSFSPEHHRRKPDPHFYLFTLPAAELRSLCGIARRQTKGLKPRKEDLGIQRQHDPERSEEIGRFVEYGFPWSTLSEARRRSNEFNDLRKPGWLPTAIVLNILGETDEREGASVAKNDIVGLVDDGAGGNWITLPYGRWSREWTPSNIPPLEVIDGQHRLWAFGPETEATTFDVPVVAFHRLDISWQAYLFWTINIKPKRINPSLAFDLYPLLRAEDWLDRAEAHPIYRETRSQELTETLWSHPESPWYDRINMLGERHIRWVSQSAWIRSLMSTLVKPWEGRSSRLGGLFGSRLSEEGDVLGWNRAQQAAFLIFSWQAFYEAVADSRSAWTKTLRAEAKSDGRTAPTEDLAFYGPHSLIVTDQGVRGFLHVLNDICFVLAPRLKLDTWISSEKPSANDLDAVNAEIKTLRKQPVADIVRELGEALATFDWRTSSASEISEDDRRQKLVFRGSSGYKEIRRQLLQHLSAQKNNVGRAAERLLQSA